MSTEPAGAAPGAARGAGPGNRADTGLLAGGCPGGPSGVQDCPRYRLVCFVLFLFLTRMRKSLPVFRRGEGSRSNISPEKLTGVAQEPPASRATVEIAVHRGRRAQAVRRAGRGCGGSADGQPGRSVRIPVRQ